MPADQAARRRDQRLAQARRLTRLELDPATCTGHGLCADLLRELVELDEWGFPMLRADAVGPDLLPHARRAVSACSTLALRLLRTRENGRTRR